VAGEKAFASLSSGLLARKGAARPAMRPQGFGQAGASLEDLGWNDMGFEPPRPATVSRDEEHDAFGEDVSVPPLRNPAAGLTPVQSPVHDQQATIVDRLAGAPADADEEADETAEPMPESVELEAPITAAFEPMSRPASRTMPRPRAAPGSKGKAAFTLRLDPDRHLRLRLACAVRGRSAQQLVTEAVDRLLDTMPELDAMAGKAVRKE
jgi:hypothetical protein